MITPDDKRSLKTLLTHPAWSLLEKVVNEEATSYRSQAMQPDVDNEYRVLLFGRAEGTVDILQKLKDIIQ